MSSFWFHLRHKYFALRSSGDDGLLPISIEEQSAKTPGSSRPLFGSPLSSSLYSPEAKKRAKAFGKNILHALILLITAGLIVFFFVTVVSQFCTFIYLPLNQFPKEWQLKVAKSSLSQKFAVVGFQASLPLDHSIKLEFDHPQYLEPIIMNYTQTTFGYEGTSGLVASLNARSHDDAFIQKRLNDLCVSRDSMYGELEVKAWELSDREASDKDFESSVEENERRNAWWWTRAWTDRAVYQLNIVCLENEILKKEIESNESDEKMTTTSADNKVPTVTASVVEEPVSEYSGKSIMSILEDSQDGNGVDENVVFSNIDDGDDDLIRVFRAWF